MPNIIEQINSDLVVALKAHAQTDADTLRGLKAEITRREKDSGETLSEPEVLKVISKEISKRAEAQKMYADAGRTELATKEATEADILKKYMPASIQGAELEAVVGEAISETAATDMKHMGAVMSKVMEKTKGMVDGKQVSELVRKRLSA